MVMDTNRAQPGSNEKRTYRGNHGASDEVPVLRGPIRSDRDALHGPIGGRTGGSFHASDTRFFSRCTTRIAFI